MRFSEDRRWNRAAALSAAGLVLIAIAAGCQDKAAPSTPITFYCAAGMRPAAAALITAFEAGHPVKIAVTYEGSGQLLGKIAAGAEGDLFMPGSAFYVDKAVEKGLILPETQRIVASFIPVFLVQKGNPSNIRTLRDLARPGVRIGLGDERSAAVGITSLDLFKKNGISYDDIQPNVVYKSGTVEELGVAVRMRTVDVAIVWDVTARSFAEYAEAVAIPADQNVVSTVPIVTLKSSRHPAEARAFIEFVTSAEGQRILADHGYSTLPGNATP